VVPFFFYLRDGTIGARRLDCSQEPGWRTILLWNGKPERRPKLTSRFLEKTKPSVSPFPTTTMTTERNALRDRHRSDLSTQTRRGEGNLLIIL